MKKIKGFTFIFSLCCLVAIGFASLINQSEYGSGGNAIGNICNGGYAVKSGNWIFFANGSDTGGLSGNDGQLYKLDAGGTEKIKICDDMVRFLNVHKDWLYYSNLSDRKVSGGGKLYRIKVDGTGKEKLNDEDCEYLNVVGDWAYYLNKDVNFPRFARHSVKT